jgi:DNA-binding transcriptional LysR family regulator
MPVRVPNPSHVQLFCEVARRQGVSAAARAVHRSQPAVTQAIHAVEKALGAQLFRRSSGGVSLTPAGALALVRCERMLERLAEGVAGLRRGSLPERIRLTGAISTAQLLALCAVVQAGGFSPAARALGQARATVHRAARSLEQALQLPLFEQTSFGIGTTRVAVELARCAALALHEFAQAAVEVAALGGGDRGRTVIGAMALARSELVPQALLAFLASHPAHSVSILDGPYDTMLGDLRGGRADLLVGALREPLPGDDLVQEHLFDDPLALALRAGHPLARSRGATPRELARFPWVIARPGAPLRGQFDALFAAGAGPDTTVECNSMVAARALLLGSDCLMLSSANQLHHELQGGELRLLPLPLGRRSRAIGLTMRRDWHPTTAQRLLLDSLRAQASVIGRRSAPRPTQRG